jgi:RHS repeat-associated protein
VINKISKIIFFAYILVLIPQNLFAYACYYAIDYGCGGATKPYTLTSCFTWCGANNGHLGQWPTAAQCIVGKCSTLGDYPGFACIWSDGTQSDINRYTHCYGSYQPQVPAQPAIKNSNSANQCGSVIHSDSLTVSEVLPIAGTNFSLVYSSDKVSGYTEANHFRIPVTQGSVDPNEQSVTLKVVTAGQVTTQTYAVAPNITYDYIWNGLDGNGNPVPGHPLPTYSISTALGSSSPYYSTFPVAPTEFYTSGVPVSPTPIGGTNMISARLGLGGWTVNILHGYNGDSGVLYLGTGETNSVGYTLIGSNFYVGSADGAELYVFDSNWNHIQTKTSLTGSVKYSFGYDGSGRLSSITDAFSNQTLFNFSSGSIYSITSPYGVTTSVTLDSNGYLATLTTPNSEVYHMTTSSSGLLTGFQKPSGTISTLNYDSYGKLISDSSSAGSSTTLALSTANYEAYNLNSTSTLGRTLSMKITSNTNTRPYNRVATNPSGFSAIYVEDQVQHQSHTSFSNSTTFASSRGSDVRFGYALPFTNSTTDTESSSSLNVTHAQSILPTSGFGAFSYTSLKDVATFNSKSATQLFTSATGVKQYTSPANRLSYVQVNSNEQPISAQQASLTAVTLGYDTHGRPAQINQGPLRVTTFGYDSSGRLNSVTNPLSQITSLTYNGDDRILTTTLPDLRVISYGYDANGNLATVTPASSVFNTLSSNGFDLLGSYVAPAIAGVNSTTSYAYNYDRQLTSITFPDTSLATFNYNTTSGLLNTIVTPTGTSTYSFNYGIPSSDTSADGVYRIFLYLGRFLKDEYVTFVTGSAWRSQTTSTYNSDLLLATERVAGSAGISSATTISFGYDRDNLVTSAGSETLTYDPNLPHLATTTLGSLAQTFSYSSDMGELSQIQASYSAANQYSEALTRDNLGRISARTETYGTTANTYGYTYDASGRLTDVTIGGVATSHYGYDLNSNRTTQTLGGTTVNPTYDAQDRIVTRGTKTYVFSPNGFLQSTSDSATSPVTTAAYVYDLFGNLKSFTPSSGSVVTFSVDAINRRSAKKVGGIVKQFYVYGNHNQLVGLLNATGAVTAQFVYSARSNVPDYMIAAGINYQIISNHLGSPTVVINSSTGVIAQQITYDEFGRVLSDTSPGFQPFGFAGGLYDTETGLTRFGARDYDASIGRWTNKDPILFAGGDTNLYGYVANDPVNWIDPRGTDTQSYGATVSGGFGGLGGTISAAYNTDNSGGSSCTYSMGPGVTSPGASFTFDITGTTAKTVSNLLGNGSVVSGGLFDYLGGALGYVSGNGYSGVTQSFGAGTPGYTGGAFRTNTSPIGGR